jgi:hypothetical protein
MPDITKQPYKNMIELFEKLYVLNPIDIVTNIINFRNEKKYTEIFENWEDKQTGGNINTSGEENTLIKLNGYEFNFYSYHYNYMAYYNLLTIDNTEKSCVVIEVNKNDGVVYIQSIQFNEKCFQQTSNEKMNKSGSILFRACLQLINMIKDRYKLKYVWLKDISEKYCDKVKNSINLDSFYMLVNGNTWYGKYNFIPFTSNKKKDRFC